MLKVIRRSRLRKNVPARRILIPKGIIHVQASLNNTIVTVTDMRGRVISWSSAGTCGFKTKRKGTPFAAQTAAATAIRTLKVKNKDMQRAEVRIKGPGIGRDAALQAIRRSNIRIACMQDITPIPHNGCRPPKKRRV
uniref:Small ribosomal subunit protein uS11c n=1 Tax=Diphelypaea coccinea TaxID=223087 RepID=A0A514TNA0_9LAMI|nr:ribosomal protein S11 [Diphelypaea coccinea]QDJ93978.1 ribosomal protein S11 [Diphelypaea coccinea]